jgi:hypothetical protein
VKLKLQGGYSVQKNRWDFFFFVDRVPSAATLSTSDPSSSPSVPSISTSSESREFVEYCELSRFAVFLNSEVFAADGASPALESLCDSNAAKLDLVGVFASSILEVEGPAELGSGLGSVVAGVVSSWFMEGPGV